MPSTSQDPGSEGGEPEAKTSRVSALVLTLASERVAIAEEEAAAIRSAALEEATRTRREAAAQVATRLSEAESAADQLVAAARTEAGEAAEEVIMLVERARRQVATITGRLGAVRETSAGVTGELGQVGSALDALERQLRLLAADPSSHTGARATMAVPPGPEAAPSTAAAPSTDAPPPYGPRPGGWPAPATPVESADAGEQATGEQPTGEQATESEDEPSIENVLRNLRPQRRLAFSASQAKLTAATLVESATDKLDRVEQLLDTPGLIGDQRGLTLLVHLRDAEELVELAAMLGHPSTDLTERLLELHRRVTQVLREEPDQQDPHDS